MKLNEQAQAVIDELDALGVQPVEALSVEEARRQPTGADAVRSLLRKRGVEFEPEKIGSVEDRAIRADRELLVRIYRPRASMAALNKAHQLVKSRSTALPVLVYIHGGGWVLTDINAVDTQARAIANRAGCIVVSVEYRRAPEHKFPAAHDDVLAATRWVMENAAEIGGDPERVAIGGESAGGNMATATCLELKRVGERLPVFQLLVYPVTDFVGQDYRSLDDSAQAKPFNTAMLKWFSQHLMSDPSQAEDPRLSPMQVPTEELAGLPPALVITAASDPVRDQGEAYAHKLMDAGVHVSLTRFPGVMHNFFGMMPVLDAARLAVIQASAALRAGFKRLEPVAQ